MKLTLRTAEGCRDVVAGGPLTGRGAFLAFKMNVLSLLPGLHTVLNGVVLTRHSLLALGDVIEDEGERFEVLALTPPSFTRELVSGDPSGVHAIERDEGIYWSRGELVLLDDDFIDTARAPWVTSSTPGPRPIPFSRPLPRGPTLYQLAAAMLVAGGEAPRGVLAALGKRLADGGSVRDRVRATNGRLTSGTASPAADRGMLAARLRLTLDVDVAPASDDEVAAFVSSLFPAWDEDERAWRSAQRMAMRS